MDYGFEELEQSKVSKEIIETVKQARIEAGDIINRLDPDHITGWASLISRLEDSLKLAKKNAELFSYKNIVQMKKNL